MREETMNLGFSHSICCAISAYNWKKWCFNPCCLSFYLSYVIV